ncbi:hypothetical protein QBC40DRAFT_284054 [Triangularia verruculosa]|uniref:Uncharacterized protein n=1 Tax=Triangularia verruculosa TaxID=2587418 RepID=A0AAN6XD46_9PEZI|nr:hypothetical protein QBC40DRAFT_284054 [Triangularia verruculosa]
MQQPTKYYFLAPPDILPNTTLQLGQLFTSLKHPHHRLCSPPPIPPSQIQTIQSASPWEWSYDVSSSTSCDLSVTAGALAQLIPLGPDLAVSMRRGARVEFTAERLETTRFDPDKDYLDKCMAMKEVQEVLKRWKPSTLYMITGMKVAYDGTKKEVFKHSQGNHGWIDG